MNRPVTSPRAIIGGGLLAALLGVAVCIALRASSATRPTLPDDRPGGKERSAAVTAPPAPPTAPSRGPGQPGSPRLLPPAPIQTARAAEDEFDRRMQQLEALREKALLSVDERARLDGLLSDPAVINHARDFLLGDTPSDLTPGDQQRRMRSVQLLSDALRWTGNPIRGDVLRACKEVILSANYHQVKDPLARKSVAADRYELFVALDDLLPGEAAQLVEDSKNTPNEKLVAFSAKVAETVNRDSRPAKTTP